MLENREKIIELAKTYNLLAMNTSFRKRPEKIAFLEKGVADGNKETEGLIFILKFSVKIG